MPVTLTQIIANTRLRVEALLQSPAAQTLEEQARLHVPRGFKRNLLEKAAQGAAVIAELKKASPSKGVIPQHFSAWRLAPQLGPAGAPRLSVLHEEEYFPGEFSNFQEAPPTTPIPPF